MPHSLVGTVPGSRVSLWYLSHGQVAGVGPTGTPVDSDAPGVSREESEVRRVFDHVDTERVGGSG